MREAAARLIEGRAVCRAFELVNGRSLRILGYHGIPDLQGFTSQLECLVSRYVPVSGQQVAHALTDSRPLPSRAIWLTFDDGFPEVASQGRDVLDSFGVTATMFVCPGVVDSDEPYWWEIVREAVALGVASPMTSSATMLPENQLKSLPDHERRATVRALANGIEERSGRRLARRQISSAQVREWCSAGHEVGNHTWDHPILDRCSPDDQVSQVRRAHEWIRETVAPPLWFFAYPNGNWSHAAEQELRKLGYTLGLGFDHRLNPRRPDPLRLSRLRVSPSKPMARFRSILAGVHPTLLSSRGRLRRLW